MECFYLGTHQADWLEQTDVPLFIARQRLIGRRTLPRARGPWALDSGGFTEITQHGRWRLGAAEFARQVRRIRDECGRLEWAAPQDWMCEPVALARSGLTVAEHQRRTTENFLELRAIAPDLPFVPVLQGWIPGQYFDHLEAYDAAGVDLRREPLVGIGSVCRRQGTVRAQMLMSELHHDAGLRLHGFGYKRTGLQGSVSDLVSADSLAWSLHARHERPLPGHTHKHCTSCLEFALIWRDELLSQIGLESESRLRIVPADARPRAARASASVAPRRRRRDEPCEAGVCSSVAVGRSIRGPSGPSQLSLFGGHFGPVGPSGR